VTRKSLLSGGFVLIFVATVAPAAYAQTESRFAIGANFTIAASDRTPTEDQAHPAFFPELLWRFGDVKPGWGPHWGLNWYAVDIDRPVGGGAQILLGELRLRPIMAGYGYTWLRGKNEISANVLGGYAFSSIELNDGVAAAYQTRLGVQATGADASNSLVLRPELNFWHDISHLFGLNVNVGYVIARPDVTITTSSGVDKRTARADQFQLRVGLVYSIF
jgi:hypothetical protein